LERELFYNKGRKRSSTHDQKKQKRLLAIFSQNRIIASLLNAVSDGKMNGLPCFALISFDER
jgi:hypothetical protein